MRHILMVYHNIHNNIYHIFYMSYSNTITDTFTMVEHHRLFQDHICIMVILMSEVTL